MDFTLKSAVKETNRHLLRLEADTTEHYILQTTDKHNIKDGNDMEAISMIVKDVRMTLLIALQILMARWVAEDPAILRSK